MLYTELTKKALKLSFQAHKDQVDKNGIPYVYHPFHLAEQMDDEYSVCVALLHDVAEDTDITVDDIRALGFPAEVTDALTLMTHDDGTEYLDYVRALSDNPIARKVKRADLLHNSDLTRLDAVDEKALVRIKKYRMALLILDKAEKQRKKKTIRARKTSCCGKLVPEDYRYCTACGKPITDAEPAGMEIDTDQTMTACSGCGRNLLFAEKYCGYCGALSRFWK